MKRIAGILAALLLFSLLLTPLCAAAGDNFDTLADWDIKIAVPDGATAVLQGNEYYLYARRAGSIPYVLLRTYRYDSAERFVKDFTAALQKERADLTLTSELEPKAVGNKLCYEIDYSYSFSGHEITVRLLATTVGERTYMFLSKEVPALGLTVGTMLEDVIANCVFLGAEESAMDTLENAAALYPCYLYCLENGMPKYWIDFSGVMAHDPVLHCFFRSGEPRFYEKCFVLDLDTAGHDGDWISFEKVTDMTGADVSDWFEGLTLRLEGELVTMEVRRDERTLAGGAEDNILSGVYEMRAAGVGGEYRYHGPDGELKYWLDPGGEELELHAMFRSDSPTPYEALFTLDVDSAEPTGEYTSRILKVCDAEGREISNWFESLTLSTVQKSILMEVRRDERTLAGGAGDNILSGVYLFEPCSYPLPAASALTPAELGRWAQIYYFRHHGFYPPDAEVTKNRDGSFSIRLFETVVQDGAAHTATAAWYTVDRGGEGVDELTRFPVRLCG